MSKIKLLHIMDKVSVAGSKIHGPARQLAYRIPFYDPERYEVRLLNLRGEDPACGILRESGIATDSLNRGKFDPRTLSDIRKMVKNWNPDLLHLHGYAAHTFGRIAGILAKVPCVVQEHFVDEHCPWFQRTADWVLRNRQAGCMAVSEAVKDFMADVRFLPREQIEVIGNGIPYDKWAAPDDPAATRTEAGIPADAVVIGTVGRLSEMKGQRFFLQACARLATQQPDTTFAFAVVGDGPLAEELRREADSLGIMEQTVFTGYQEDVKSWIDLLDIGVVSSIFGEGFCSVGIEILASGTPLVITDLPCFRGIYTADENVLQVPGRDAEAMADAMGRILEDPDLRERLVKAGNATGRAYDMPRIAEEYDRYYTQLLE